LSGKPEQRVVTAPGPSRPSRNTKQCVQFRFSQEGNEPSVEALRRNGEHTLDHGGMLGMPKRRAAEQRADRGEPSVTGAHTVFPLVLEVIEEGADERGIKVVDVQLRRLRAAPLGRKDQHQSQGVPIGSERMRAGLTLTYQAVREERL
jgi:hypothetical protein